jgi:lipoyl(octanoyl) transferase
MKKKFTRRMALKLFTHKEEEQVFIQKDFKLTKPHSQVTWHGPGQVVFYPVIDLTHLGKGKQGSVKHFVHSTQEIIMDALAKLGIQSQATEDVGVWIEGQRKIAAIGIAVSKWVTMHGRLDENDENKRITHHCKGYAVNVSNDLGPFREIIPCGLQDKDVTSVSNELKRHVSIAEVTPMLLSSFERVFQTSLQEVKEPFDWEAMALEEGKTIQC